MLQHLPGDELRLLITGHDVPVDAMAHQRRQVRVGTRREQRAQAAPLPVVVKGGPLMVIEDARGFDSAAVEDEHSPAAEAVVQLRGPLTRTVVNHYFSLGLFHRNVMS